MQSIWCCTTSWSTLDSPRTYAQTLFMEFISAFNMIILDIPHCKLSQLSVPTYICNWITKLPHQQRVTGETGRIHTQLFSIDTNDCTSGDSTVKILKFADDTAVICLIQDGNKSAYRQEVDHSLLCRHNNLELNTNKTV